MVAHSVSDDNKLYPGLSHVGDNHCIQWGHSIVASKGPVWWGGVCGADQDDVDECGRFGGRARYDGAGFDDDGIFGEAGGGEGDSALARGVSAGDELPDHSRFASWAGGLDAAVFD